MISRFADLLRAIQEKQIQVLSEQDVTHGPTIGEMYEGLTADVLNRGIPKIEALQVVRGFARGLDGSLSPEIDCMVVKGSGSIIPHTSKHIFSISDVLAVFEVKKTLSPRELRDAGQKLKAVTRVALEYHLKKHTPLNFEKIATSFALMTGRFVGNLDMANALDGGHSAMFNLLSQEFMTPLRFVYSYGGYETEAGLRTSFVNFLEEQERTQLDLIGAPSQIVCGNLSLLKGSGNPYCLSTDSDEWPLFVSNNENPIRIMLELLWDKLASVVNQGLYFNDDLQQEKLVPLIVATWDSTQSPPQFKLRTIEYTNSQIREYDTKAPWEPSEVDEVEMVVILHLNEHGPCSKEDAGLVSYCRETGADASAVIARLLKMRLIAESNAMIYPIHDPVVLVFTPEGKTWASFDQHLLSSWLEQREITAGKGRQ